MTNELKNNGINPQTGKAWSCEHCHAINNSRQPICGCAKSRKASGRELGEPVNPDSIRLEW